MSNRVFNVGDPITIFIYQQICLTQPSFKASKAYQYALDALDSKFPTNKYIKAICEKFLYEINHQEELFYYFDYDVADKIINIVKLINIATEELKKCRLQELFDWCGRDVYLDIDLAMTTDNCAVAMVTEEDGKVYANVELIANTIDNLEVKLYKEYEGSMEEVKGNKRVLLLNDEPNAFMTGDELKKAMVRVKCILCKGHFEKKLGSIKQMIPVLYRSHLF